MSPSLSELLKRPAGERAELAMALWESGSEARRREPICSFGVCAERRGGCSSIGFPYAVCFRVVGDDIVVLAVHGRQPPRHWQSRA